jgi:SAM-dependent methyltransferase
VAAADRPLAYVRDGELSIPLELFDTLERPPTLRFTHREDHAYLNRVEVVPDEKRPGGWLDAWSGKRLGMRLAELDRLTAEAAVYRYAGEACAEAFTITNGHPKYLLLPYTGAPDADDRQQHWQSRERYHEHLAMADQDPVVHQVSEWLAREVLAPLQPASVLEVGCGSGRNLVWAHRVIPHARLVGVDINPYGVEVARRELGDAAALSVGSAYDLGGHGDGSIDVVLTSGVLMHLPHDEVPRIIGELHRIARTAVVHFELHGPSHRFDFHRYPRDYARLYAELGLGTETSYEVFPHGDFRTNTTRPPFHHAVLVSRQPA